MLHPYADLARVPRVGITEKLTVLAGRKLIIAVIPSMNQYSSRVPGQIWRKGHLERRVRIDPCPYGSMGGKL